MAQLPPGPRPVDRVRDQPPEDPQWRADALAQSGHSRLEDELREPLDDHDPEKAAEICAQVSRDLLGDLAPALLLLPERERVRVQALCAFARTLFDFARQSGLEGEKLAQINRWCFDLEAALDGEPPGQPVFVQMAACERGRPWPREALDGIAAAARNRAMKPRVRSAEEAADRAERLGRSLAEALVPDGGAGFGPLGGALLRVRALEMLHDDQRRHLSSLPIEDLPDAVTSGREADEALTAAAIDREIVRLRPLLVRIDLATLRPPWRRAASYAVRVARRALERPREFGREPRPLGLGPRLAILLLSRLRPL